MRERGIEVIYTTIEAYTLDGRDISLDGYRKDSRPGSESSRAVRRGQGLVGQGVGAWGIGERVRALGRRADRVADRERGARG